jgi:hypothetical protein
MAAKSVRAVTDRFDRVGVAERCQGVSGCTYGGCAEGPQPFVTIEDFARTERSPRGLGLHVGIGPGDQDR